MESAKNLNRMEITIPYHGINLDLASFQYNLSALSKEKTSAKQSAKTSRKSSAAKENLKKIAHDYQIALPKLNPAPSIPIQTQISFPRQAKNHSKHS